MTFVLFRSSASGLQGEIRLTVKRGDVMTSSSKSDRRLQLF